MTNQTLSYVRGREKMVSAQQLADRWGVSRDTIYRLMNTGELRPWYVIGNQRRVPESVVEEYLEKRRRESDADADPSPGPALKPAPDPRPEPAPKGKRTAKPKKRGRGK
jgi:excisionase family DNA binding protein